MQDGPLTILGIPGSLRRASINRGLLRAAQEISPDVISIQIEDLAPLPFYNADVEALALPAPVVQFRERVARADALLLAVPEYNHSYTAILKNALDWASRPRPVSALLHKPVALIGAGGGFGTIRAQMALRPVLTACEMHLLLRPELYVPGGPERFNAAGDLLDETFRIALREVVTALAAWTRRLGER